MAEPIYRRLTRSRPGRKSFLSALSSPRQGLWLGADHLLSVEGASYYEEYKRYYFRDIQAIFTHPTARRAIWNGILSALLIMHLLVLAWFGASATTLVIVAFILGVPLVVNNLLGPACRVYLRTAVQVDELASLSRVRRASRVLEQIRPLIAAEQGALPAAHANDPESPESEEGG